MQQVCRRVIGPCRRAPFSVDAQTNLLARLQGTIAAFEVLPPQRSEPEGYLNPIGRQLQRRLLAEGVFLRPLGQVVYLLPPLCISDAELRQCYGALATALREL